MRLGIDFYQRNDVLKIAQDLIGKCLFTQVDGVTTGGIIVETEAYSWTERGCHAYNARKTKRNAVMFDEGGLVYVFLCYGMHNLFNIVTNKAGIAEAVLVRAIEPVSGIEEMKKRRGQLSNEKHLTSGPGKLTKALGISRTFNGKSLLNAEVWLEDRNTTIAPSDILVTPRIGIDYAGEDAALPWRFAKKSSAWLSQ